MRAYPEPLSPGVAGWTLLAILVASTLIAMGEPVLTIQDRVGRNHNEGWNAYHISGAQRGMDLYPSREQLVSNNYPPLSFHVVARIVPWPRDAILAGRWVALCSLLLAAGFCGLITWGLTGSRFAGGLAAWLALGSLAAHFQNYVAMNDPQLLGHALQLGGLWLALRGPRGRLLALVPLLLGALVKHNLIPVPLGLGLWLLLHRRAEATRWWVVVGLLLLGTGLLLRWTYGADALNALLRHPRTYETHLFALALRRWITPLVPILAGGTALLFLRPRPRELPLLYIAGVALGLGSLSTFGAGVSVNALFDTVFLFSILSAITFHRIAISPWTAPGVAPALLLSLGVTIHLAAPLHLLRGRERAATRTERVAAAAQDIALVARQPGPAMCEDPAVCFWAGKSYTVDFFNLHQKLRRGVVDGAELALLIQRRALGAIQLDREGHSPFLSDRINHEIRANYRLARASEPNGYLYLPR